MPPIVEPGLLIEIFQALFVDEGERNPSEDGIIEYAEEEYEGKRVVEWSLVPISRAEDEESLYGIGFQYVAWE